MYLVKESEEKGNRLSDIKLDRANMPYIEFINGLKVSGTGLFTSDGASGYYYELIIKLILKEVLLVQRIS